MWFEIFLIFWAIHSYPNRCSLVIDKYDVEGILLNDYCPNMPHCSEGAHVMCMYFNPHRIAGPRCSFFQNISVNNEIADHLLEIVNEMRGQVASGTETGKGNVTLPRGYGMFKLKWDNELATFAQVLANTCTLMNDVCRATERFPQPGQLAAMVRFTIPDWLPLVHRSDYSGKGLTSTTIQYATKEATRFWYSQKNYVTLDMINNVPDWLSQPNNIAGRMFLQLMDGHATHMGCGVSAYVEYAYYALKPADMIFNAIHIICNFSSEPKKHTSVYNTKKMTTEEICPKGDKRCVARYKSKCGCPPDTDEDDRCLCTDIIPHTNEKSCGNDNSCKPAVVLLPIFTVEDAPPSTETSRQGVSKEIERAMNDEESQHFGNYEIQENEIVKDFRKHNNKPPRVPSRYTPCNHDGDPTSYIMNSLEPPYRKKRISARSISRNDKIKQTSLRRQISRKRVPDHTYRRAPPVKKKPSIFSRAPKFELHGSKPSQDRNQAKNNFIKDVTPRKNFTYSKQVLEEYRKGKHRKETVLNDEKESVYTKEIEHYESTKPSVTIRPRFKGTVIKPNYNLNISPARKPVHIKTMHFENVFKRKKGNIVRAPHHAIISVKKNVTKFNNLGFDDDAINHVNNNFNDDTLNHVNNNFDIEESEKPKRFHDDAINHVKNNFDIEESDRKLMTLLDSLEQEVKHVELDGAEKEIFDAKLKKIYGSISKKSKPDIVESKEHESKVQKRLSFKNEEFYKYDTDFDDNLLSDATDDRKWDESEKEMYDTEDMVTNFQSKDTDEKSSKNLYAAPVPRRQRTIRPRTNKKVDYIYRNTEDLKNTIDNNHYDSSKRSDDDEIKTLPYDVEYKRKNRYNDYQNPHKKLPREDNERRGNLKPIDEKRDRHKEESLFDYDGNKKSIYLNNRNIPYEEDYGKDYIEDQLSTERRQFYQDRLDNMNKNKYSSSIDRPVNDYGMTRRRLPPPRGQYILGPRRSNTGANHYHLPNRASHHRY